MVGGWNIFFFFYLVQPCGEEEGAQCVRPRGVSEMARFNGRKVVEVRCPFPWPGLSHGSVGRSFVRMDGERGRSHLTSQARRAVTRHSPSFIAACVCVWLAVSHRARAFDSD